MREKAMKVYILNALDIGMDTINVLKKHLAIAGVIGLSKRDPSDHLSGYRHMEPYCRREGIPYIELETYGLTRPGDTESLARLEIDVLIVAGWQRLIPEWLIKRCRYGAIGSHGSAVGITGGRGRSPQNWALLLGSKEFYISIFKINPGIDSGEIIDTKCFPLDETDDIKTSYYKVSWLTAHMMIESLKNGTIASGRFQRQTGEAKYLPQRTPEDGGIDWSRTAHQVYDFVRALGRPYPGAFSVLGRQKLIVWRARPFQLHDWNGSGEPGEIVKLFENRDFLVKTGDGLLLVEDYSWDEGGGDFRISEGTVLLSVDFEAQMQGIAERH
jgi:methionyl-tRNA formyltransferase